MSRPIRGGGAILLSVGIAAWGSVSGGRATERAPAREAEPPARVEIVVHRPDAAAATLALAQQHALILARDDPPARQTKL